MMHKKSPEIRFKGFTDDWEQRKVGEFLEESKIPGSDGSIAKKLTVKLWGKGVIPKEEIYKGSASTNYYIRKQGQFIYGKLDFLNQAFGIIPKELDGYESTLDSPAFDILQGLNAKYFLEYVSRKEFYLFQGTIANGSRRAKRIHSDTFFNMPIVLPSIEEQEKIGKFFDTLDHTIALHQDAIQRQQYLKKALLQKLFPVNGEGIPTVRFATFKEEWEQRKLGDTVRITMGQSPSGENYTENPKDHILVQGNADMKNGRVVPRIWTTQVTKNADPDDIILSVRAPVGDVGKTDYPVVLGRGVAGISGNAFIFQTLSRMKEIGFWTRYSSGSTFESVNSADLKDAVISIPNIEEQTKIGDFFTKLDGAIALRQDAIHKLQLLKQSLLQKMFVN